MKQWFSFFQKSTYIESYKLRLIALHGENMGVLLLHSNAGLFAFFTTVSLWKTLERLKFSLHTNFTAVPLVAERRHYLRNAVVPLVARYQHYLRFPNILVKHGCPWSALFDSLIILTSVGNFTEAAVVWALVETERVLAAGLVLARPSVVRVTWLTRARDIAKQR